MHKLLITPLMEQQMFDDWCPYSGNPDPRTVWSAAIEAVNGLHLTASQPKEPKQETVIKTVWVVGGKTWQQICATQEDVHKLIADMGMNTPSLYPSMSEVPLLSYTTPPQRKSLTCFDTEKLAKQCGVEWTTRIDKLCKLAIETAHNIKE